MADLQDLTPHEWTRDALCAEADPELFFPDRGGSPKAARAVCGRCRVTTECLGEALALTREFSTVHGIWGGTTERDRRLILEGRR